MADLPRRLSDVPKLFEVISRTTARKAFRGDQQGSSKIYCGSKAGHKEVINGCDEKGCDKKDVTKRM